MPTAPQRAVNFLYATYRIKIRKRGVDTRYSAKVTKKFVKSVDKRGWR